MKDSEFIKKMLDINYILKVLADTQPYDEDAFASALDEMHRINHKWYRSRRHYPRFFVILLWILFGILIGLVFRILFLT